MTLTDSGWICLVQVNTRHLEFTISVCPLSRTLYLPKNSTDLLLVEMKAIVFAKFTTMSEAN